MTFFFPAFKVRLNIKRCCLHVIHKGAHLCVFLLRGFLLSLQPRPDHPAANAHQPSLSQEVGMICWLTTQCVPSAATSCSVPSELLALNFCLKCNSVHGLWLVGLHAHDGSFNLIKGRQRFSPGAFSCREL